MAKTGNRNWWEPYIWTWKSNPTQIFPEVKMVSYGEDSAPVIWVEFGLSWLQGSFYYRQAVSRNWTCLCESHNVTELTIIFIGHHEKLWLENFHGSTILFYRRYVDDTFCLFNSDRDATIFFDYINFRHPNIKFTMEKQVNHKLPFLDILIDNHDPNSSLTRVYRKKTFTGSLTNYFSFTSYSY